MLIEMADDTNLIMGEDEMDMDNSLSKSNIMAIKQHKNMSIKINQGDDSNSKKHDQSPLQGLLYAMHSELGDSCAKRFHILAPCYAV